ncbi:DUF7619 domain-containing protein [Aquimarina agarilytica]|uniref:DUF7619 domain-containing protein n=1 Tax=Aquimarina agarilytica TaxID=1087449 RepID=UPI000289AEDB|nr:T9SS type A sorting domain-containing protein [Aquimarina agarilytica]
MKNNFLFFIALLMLCFYAHAQRKIQFQDSNFKQALLDHIPKIDMDGDLDIDVDEAKLITKIKITSGVNPKVIAIGEIKYFESLEVLHIENQLIRFADLSQNLALKELNLINNNRSFSQINIEKNVNLEVLRLQGMDFFPPYKLNVSSNINLKTLQINNTDMYQLDLSKNLILENLDISNNEVRGYFRLRNLTKLKTVDISNNEIGRLLVLNCTALNTLNVDNNSSRLRDLTIIQVFGGTLLNTIDVSSLSKLSLLEVENSNISTIDLSYNLELNSLNLNNNKISSIDLTLNKKLSRLELVNNNLTEIDISKNTRLLTVLLESNNLKTLDLTKNERLEILNVSRNKLSELNVLQNIKLERLFVAHNMITQLDVRNNDLFIVDFSHNINLISVLATGQPFTIGETTGFGMFLNNTPNLQFICVDNQFITLVNDRVLDANQQDKVIVSDNCQDSFVNFEGKIIYDIDGDGCDSNDPSFLSSIKISALPASGGVPLTVFPNDLGVYAFNLDYGTYSFFADIGNDDLFLFNGPQFDFSKELPTDLDTVLKEFCVGPRGNFNDLEIQIIPLNRARPGFESEYLIRYSNIGTTTQSGSIAFKYDSDIATFTSSSIPVVNNSSGSLSWNFSNLSPMQFGEINVKFVLNRPTDTPPLNGGDVINYLADVIISDLDADPSNNQFEFSQDIVNSYDPNDKTCLEGNILDPNDVGKYLHYLIRFENKGSAEAVNVKIVDKIDTSKLDIESFVPLKGSHSYTTTIIEENRIEFNFNAINLPFEDDTNDGYVLFKIKTKINLNEGDTIANKASIYFDFNPPIITNNEVVTIKKEVNEIPVFDTYFSLYPNPAESIISLSIKDPSVTIQNVTIMDFSGNLVGIYFVNFDEIFVTHLFEGVHFISVQTNKGIFKSSFVKI